MSIEQFEHGFNGFNQPYEGDDDEDYDNTPLNNFAPIKRKGSGKIKIDKRKGKTPWRNSTNKRGEFVKEEREYENNKEE